MMNYGVKVKKFLICMLSAIMLISLAIGLTAYRPAKADGAAPTTFATVQGAEIRTHEEVERYGIRYTIKMSATEYETFMGAGYTDVEFGMFVIPADYKTTKGAFTKENLFTAPIYYWGDVEESYKTGKTEIINMCSESLDMEQGDNKVLYAVITNVKPQNVTRPFIGVGYLAYNDGTGMQYIISESESRSIAQVAKTALDDVDSGLSTTEISNLEDILDAKPAVKLNVTKGGEVADDTVIADAISAINYKIGDTIDVTRTANINAPVGFKVDAENSTLSAEIPTSGLANIDVKYVAWGDSTGNIASYAGTTNIVSSKKASSVGQVFDHDNDQNPATPNILYFTCVRNNDNGMLFDSDYVKAAFDAGLTEIRFTYYLSGVTNPAWAKLKPGYLDASNNNAFVPFAAKDTPYFTADYQGVENAKEIKWKITDSEVASIDFAGGDVFAFDGLAAGENTKLYFLITSFEFAAPQVSALSDNLLERDNRSEIFTPYLASSSNNSWAYHTTSSLGKYVDANALYISKGGWSCDASFYLDSEFVNGLLDEGKTVMTIVAVLRNFANNPLADSDTDSSLVLYVDYNASTDQWGSSTSANSMSVGENNLRTYTFDLSAKDTVGDIAIFLGGSIERRALIFEVSFTAPEQA